MYPFFVAEFLLVGLQMVSAASPQRQYKILTHEPSPLTSVDPPELQFLHHTSFAIQFTGGTTYNNVSYLLNWSKEMIFPGNRRFWYANFASDRTATSQIFLRNNLTTCVYDVTGNAKFTLLHKMIQTTEDYTNYIIIQCPLDDCTVEDFGCGKRPFPWWRLVIIGSFLLFVMMLVQLRRNGLFLSLIGSKHKKHFALPTEQPPVSIPQKDLA